MAPPSGAVLWRRLAAYQVFGANTAVGKTVFSAILCNGITKLRPTDELLYLKPVSTGPQDEADQEHILRFTQAKPHCMYQFAEPISPHLAAGNDAPSDVVIANRIRGSLEKQALRGPGWAIAETAGGVHSPTPQGTSQADAYRPLRLPVLLVGDHKLGGISTTIAAYEALHIRGYDIAGIVIFGDNTYKNAQYLRQVFEKRQIPVLEFPTPPEKGPNDYEAMEDYYQETAKRDITLELVSLLATKHVARLERLDEMSYKSRKLFWYPFTQHGLLDKKATVIDSAYGDFYQTSSHKTHPNTSALTSSFDGSASWWTQGLGHGNPELTLAAAHAAGRYGHTIFADTVHEPALKLAELLIDDRSQFQKRAFFSDNGSTGMEVALKMALRTACSDYGWDASKENIGVIGLTGSYHGDTIGVMDASEPSVYNKRVEWYRGRGFWFDFPKVQMKDGKWRVKTPPDMAMDDFTLTGLSHVMRPKRVVPQYKVYIQQKLDELVSEGRKFGALVIEPIILGAGGMHFCDPAFQRALVEVVRSTRFSNSGQHKGIPVIYDEVFTGMYRLGRITSGSFLGVSADISVHAKTLTGGLVPLCITLARERMFEAFHSKDKTDALLHGHSYTAHPVGCAVAVKALQTMFKMDRDGTWKVFKDNWLPFSQLQPSSIGPSTPDEVSSPPTADGAQPANAPQALIEVDDGLGAPSEPAEGVAAAEAVGNALSAADTTSTNSTLAPVTSQPYGEQHPWPWSMWRKEFVFNLSKMDNVEGIWALGSVLAVELKDEQGQGGYTSTAAQDVRSILGGVYDIWNVHCRVLGNVLYLMASQTSTKEHLLAVEARLRRAIIESLKNQQKEALLDDGKGIRITREHVPNPFKVAKPIFERETLPAADS